MPQKIIPIEPAADPRAGDCAGAEPVALMVLGDSMLPEFAEGEIVVIEPEGLVRDGSFVVAQLDGEPALRQLVRRDGRWWLHALNPRHADAALADLAAVKGVVIQKSRPGSRRSRKSYVD